MALKDESYKPINLHDHPIKSLKERAEARNETVVCQGLKETDVRYGKTKFGVSFRLDQATIDALFKLSSQAGITRTAYLKKLILDPNSDRKYYVEFSGPFTIAELIEHLKSVHDVSIRTEDEFQEYMSKAIGK